jgi:uridine phosphorylase
LFFREVVDKVITEHNATIVVDNRWEDSPHPVYEISYRDYRLASFHPGVEAPLVTRLLEEAIASSCRKFIASGGCGILEERHSDLELLLIGFRAVLCWWPS